MKILKGNYGECRFIDCIEGMKELEDKSFDLCLTDPPYNVKCQTMTPKFDKSYQESKIRYKDNLSDEDYRTWCHSWFNEIKTNMIVFTPGYKNLKFWMKDFDFELAILYDISSKGGCVIASFRKWEPILTQGIRENRKQHKRFKFAIFEEINNVNQFNFKEYLHPCPKNYTLWNRIIKELKPLSVLDPFLGSGTTAEVCESLGIPWLGFELMEEYAPDIEKRIARGLSKKKYLKKQTTLL